MSSVTSARAPTRRASAAVSLASARAALSLGPVGLDGGDAAGDEGQDEEDDGAGEHEPRSRRISRAWARARSAALAASASVACGRLRGSRVRSSVSAEAVLACQSSARASRTPR